MKQRPWQSILAFGLFPVAALVVECVVVATIIVGDDSGAWRWLNIAVAALATLSLVFGLWGYIEKRCSGGR